MLVHGFGQSAEVAMRFSLVCFKKNTNSQLFSSTPLQSLVIYHFSSKFHSNRWLQIAPLARRPFWNHFESGYFFGPKLSFQTIHLKKRVASMLIESKTKWAASIQHQSKFKGLMVPTSEMEHIDLSYKLFVCLLLHICTFCCCAYIFLFIIWAASATGWWFK